MTDEKKKGNVDPDEQTPPSGGDAFSGMESLGRSFLEKNEQSQGDLRALRDMHRRRTRQKPEDPEA